MQKICRGAGLGLRSAHVQHVLHHEPDIPWFEMHICNYLYGAASRSLLGEVGTRYALSFHSVSLNLGGVDPINKDYLNLLKRAEREIQPSLVSDHLCFTANDDKHYHDLLPIPYTEESLIHVAKRISEVQNTLQRQILIENVSQYYLYDESSISEADFLNDLCAETGCGLILDINNSYVNAQNHKYDIHTFLKAIHLPYIAEIHLGGHEKQHDHAEAFLVDTHSTEVCEDVWQLYDYYANKLSDIPCLVEWDTELPEFEVLEAQQKQAQFIMDSVAKMESQRVCL